MSDVKWIRLSVDIFDNRKIKHIRRSDMGERRVLIWIYLLTLAGKCNSGGDIFLTPGIPYSNEELAEEIGVFCHDIEESLELFESLGMITRSDGVISVTNWEEYQNAQGLDRIREQARIRTAKWRESKASKGGEDDSSVTVASRLRHGDAIEEEIRIRNKNKNINKQQHPSGIDDVLKDLSEDMKETMREFLKMRKAIKKPMTDRAVKLLLTKLGDLASDEHTQKAILNQSIEQGWASVYPLKENRSQGDFRNQKRNPALDYAQSEIPEGTFGKDFFVNLDAPHFDTSNKALRYQHGGMNVSNLGQDFFKGEDDNDNDGRTTAGV